MFEGQGEVAFCVPFEITCFLLSSYYVKTLMCWKIHVSWVETFSTADLMQATDDNKQTKTKSIVCPDCEGNGEWNVGCNL